jgi:hypothetical protein
MTGNGVKRFISLFDIHFPHVDWGTLRAALDFMSRERVDGIILGGDNLDCGPISRHNKNKPLHKPRGQMKKDLDGFNAKVLRPIEKLLPKGAARIWLTGNHEDWAEQLIEEMPELEGLLDFPVYLHLQSGDGRYSRKAASSSTDISTLSTEMYSRGRVSVLVKRAWTFIAPALSLATATRRPAQPRRCRMGPSGSIKPLQWAPWASWTITI